MSGSSIPGFVGICFYESANASFDLDDIVTAREQVRKAVEIMSDVSDRDLPGRDDSAGARRGKILDATIASHMVLSKSMLSHC